MFLPTISCVGLQVLSKASRGKFLRALGVAHRSGEIERDPQEGEVAYRQRKRALYRHDWVVYAKTALGGGRPRFWDT